MRTTITLLAAIVLLASCNQYQKTPSGLAYKITKGSSKENFKNGQFVKFNIEYTLGPKDSVLTSSYGHIPGYVMIDTSRPARHSFLEVITKCGVGDKIQVVMSVDSLKKMGMLDYNNIFHPRDMIKGKIEFLGVYNSQPEAAADNAKEAKMETDREIKTLKELAAKKSPKTVTTPMGVVVDVANPGDPSAKADSGTTAKVMYRGTLTDGKLFDTNMDPSKPNAQPLMVNIGGQPGTPGAVIPGMDQALRLFGKGGKGTMYIPAMLAYGQGGQPPVIPAYANLVFDVEVLDVTRTPAQPAQPAGPAPVVPQKK